MQEVKLKDFASWLEKGDKKLQKEPVRPRTIETYVSLLKNHLECIPQSDTSRAIEIANDNILQTGTYQLGVAVRQFCFYKGYKNWKKITIPKLSKKKPEKFLTHEELNEIFTKVEKIDKIPYFKQDKKQLSILLRFMYETGGRINEVLNIKYKDINFEKDKIGGGYVIKLYELTPDIIKRGEARSVLIADKTIRLLLEHMKKNNITKKADKIIFTKIHDQNDRKMNQTDRLRYRKLLINRMNVVLRYIGRKIIGKPITNHWFRHTCFTHMALGEVDLQLIKEYAGHSSVTVTEKYLRAARIMSKKAFAKWQRDKGDVR